MRLIDADALIAEMHNVILECGEDRRTFYEVIERQQTIEPEQQWIPVSSGKLPDELQEVNITWVNHRPESYYEHIKDKPFNGSAVYYKDKWYWYSQYCVDTLKEYGDCEFDEMDDAIEVTAWCPLPEPRKGEV